MLTFRESLSPILPQTTYLPTHHLESSLQTSTQQPQPSLEKINPGKPNPSRVSPATTFMAGCFSGAVARMLTNSPREIASNLQNTTPMNMNISGIAQRFASRKNLTSCTLGTSMQYASIYSLKGAIENPEDSQAERITKDAACAVAGGLVIHPSTVAFYHQDSNPLKSGAQNQLNLLQTKPQDFTRGLMPRILASTSQWVTFFSIKDLMHKNDYSQEQSRAVASLAGVCATTPFYQAYAYQCRNGGSTLQALAQVGQIMIKNPQISGLFALAAATEMYIGDFLTHHIEAALTPKSQD